MLRTGAVLAQHRVLVIDDSQLVLQVTRVALEQAGYAVSTALTIAAFEEERHRAPPDIIILDVQMPEAFGDDLALTLRGAYNVTAPVILLSSLEDEELAQRAKYAGAQGWVSKRSGIEALLSKI